ncbi:ASST-domain-containing protein [Xylariaceae sp. FL0804]|nr:ASST-domain-containing protein [Xylariaceae sp. FL0804]
MRLSKYRATIALLAGQAAASSHIVNDYDAYMNGDYGLEPNVSFKSTDIVMPLFQVSKWDKEKSGLAGGYIVMGTAVGDQQGGVMMLRGDDLSLVYASVQAQGGSDSNVQTLNGKSVITVFSQQAPEHSANYDLIYDDTLNLEYNFTTVKMPVLADAHEFFITEENTAIVTAYEFKSWDLTSVGGPSNGTLIDSCFEDVDFINNKPVFRWCPSDYFPPSQSLVRWNATSDPELGGFDAYHMNAISQGPDGNYLVSLRHLAAFINVNATDGSVIWALGGAVGNFTYAGPDSGKPGYVFQYQHEVRWASEDMTQVSMFDNHIADGDPYAIAGACAADGACSRGLVVSIDYDAMTFDVAGAYPHPRDLSCFAMGSNLQLPNGNRLVSWGKEPSFTEHADHGNGTSELVAEIEYGLWNGSAFSYRTFWVPEDAWVSNPTTKPDVAVEDGSVYVSWNGATRVAEWAVLACGKSKPIVTAMRDGFETKIPIAQYNLTQFSVAALDKDGTVLATSESVTM